MYQTNVKNADSKEKKSARRALSEDIYSEPKEPSPERKARVNPLMRFGDNKYEKSARKTSPRRKLTNETNPLDEEKGSRRRRSF